MMPYQDIRANAWEKLVSTANYNINEYKWPSFWGIFH